MTTTQQSALQARVAQRNGMPVMEINGVPTPPLIFFFNTEVEWGWPRMTTQVRLAAEAGVHIHSFPLPWPWCEDDGREPDFSEGEDYMRRFLEVDPQALFIPRIRCEGSTEWALAHPEELVQHFADRPEDARVSSATNWMTSMASDRWMETLLKGLTRMIRHFESGPYADHILAYHPSGQNSNEWFHYEYYLYGPDVSEVNQLGFRRWLRNHYGTDAALASAWGLPAATIDAARIPNPIPCPQAESPDYEFPVFLTGAADQARVDYNTYSSSIMADRVLEICAHLRRETLGRKLIALFYGYFFELQGFSGGHYAMQRVLASPDIDLLASPISYMDRVPGGPASFMTAIESVAAHGKLWITENDYRTHALDTSRLPDWASVEGLGPQAKDQAETLGVIARDYGAVHVHRCGTWWMDLIAGGAYEDPAYWKLIGDQLRPQYEQLLSAPEPYRPEVAVIVDEESAFRVRHQGKGGAEVYNPLQRFGLHRGREVYARTGAAIGYYYISDFLAGHARGAKVYAFPNLYGASDALIAQVRAQLDAEGALALWQFAPGYFGPQGSADLARMQRLTGIAFASDAGRLGSLGHGPLAGQTWGEPLRVSPRLAVADAAAEVLGTYAEGNAVSAARWQTGSHRGLFMGDVGLSSQALATLFGEAGAHCWTRDGSTVQTDGHLLFVHAAQPGEVTVHLPTGMKAQPLSGAAMAAEADSITLPSQGHATHILALSRR